MKFNLILYRTTPFLVFFLGIWYFCIRILGYGLELVPGDLGDARFINYLLEHGYHWLKGDVSSFWNAEFLYPFKNTIAMSDNMLGTMPIYAAFRFFGCCPETSYQLWWISICALNYWFAYIIFNKWFHRSDIAIVLAWIFSFTTFNIGQLNYMQMIIRFMVPVVFYAAYRMMEKPSVKYLALYCLGIVVQFYCVMYTGFYLFYFSLFFLLSYYLISKKWKDLLFYFNKKNLFISLGIFGLTLVAMLILMVPYLKMSKVVGMLGYGSVKANIPYLSDYFFPHMSSITWKFLIDPARPNVADWWLHWLFPGMIPTLALFISPFLLLYNKYHKIQTPLIIKSLIVTAAIIALLHIQIKNGISLYVLLFELPGMRSIRVLIRFMNVELFLLLSITGYFLLKIKNKKIIFLFLLLAFADNFFEADKMAKESKAELIQRKEFIINELQKANYQNYKVVALIDTSVETYVSNLDMMLAAQALNAKTANGYSSYCPQHDLFDFTKLNKEEGLYNWLSINNIEKNEALLLKLNTKMK
jgi:hypothetical protein